MFAKSSNRKTLLLFLATLCALVMPAQVFGATPATKPAIPALIVGGPPPSSFVVDGTNRFSATGGLAFHVATDGKRQLCAVYDPADGTPLLLSDGHQTLVYDLANSRVVRVPESRATVQVEWDNNREPALTLSLSVQVESAPEKLDKHKSSFRIDRFVDGSFAAMKELHPGGNDELFSAERKGGTIDSVQVEPGNPKWFRFTSLPKGKDFYQIELQATKIGEQVPESALVFPDPQKFPLDVHLLDLERHPLTGFVVALANGRAWFEKLALAGGPEMRARAKEALPDANWEELRERDAKFGAAYRRALSAQGLELHRYAKPATTQAGR